MSLDTTSKRIQCDSSDCNAQISVPLRTAAVRGSKARGTASPAAGWMFISGVYEDRHYCPDCTGKRIMRQAA